MRAAFVIGALTAGLGFAGAVLAADDLRPLLLKPDHRHLQLDRAKAPASVPRRAALIQSTCSPVDERKGLCNRSLITPDPPDRPAKLTAEEHQERGVTFMIFGLFASAIKAFNEAIRLKPDYAEAFNNRGSLYFGTDDRVRALADYNEAIRLSPRYADAFFNRAQLYKAEGAYEAAIDDYDVYVTLKPDDPDGFVNRAFSHRQLGHYALAIADFDQVIRIKPQDAAAWNARCWTRGIAGTDLRKALADCNESLRLRPRHGETLDSRGLIYFRLGDFKRSVADNTAALKINPKSASSLYIRGLARLRTGKLIQGNADIAEAEALDPKVAATYEAYGVDQ